MDDLIKNPLKKGINWYRACMLIFALAGPVSIWLLQAWMESNFVTSDRDGKAWEKQVEINEKLSHQVVDLTTARTKNDTADEGRDKRLANLEQDLRDQRQILFMIRK